MSSFSKKTFNAQNYDKFRPKYTADIYNKIKQYHKGGKNLLIDVGCGPGTATFQMIDYLSDFKSFKGTDISDRMIGAATLKKVELNIPDEKLAFFQSSCDDFSFLKEFKDNQKADMITAVECVHWFDFQKFQEAAAKNLSKNGTLAIWGYREFFVPEYPEISTVVRSFLDDDNVLGPYFEQPGHTIMKNLWRDLKFDTKYFKDIDEIIYHSEDFGKNPSNDLYLLQHKAPVKILKHLLTTTSAYQDWKEAHPNDKDLSDVLLEKIYEVYPELNENTILDVKLSTIFKFARKI
ncbi:hypothetical protein TBLA_0F03870 [Henningerozyma blattae CBS 6284]|uniref:Methyltransferase type 11 domain-containing protein n=1 Tax=Henningerozyma blattae (strain ATCC 34711 / CBS 6284 / DSM 70876 / NBRC 10599 / NRRL Y-10934 / UCD 77-7) TaxID=1071380 RepID=I2H6B9_HENB6|nr:hypothetical protein TBLA_0F03870 [Tetrapisispora blattae CBS 6284]CCH61921.1 hypothetical protein TBLA_0F03870 [Tetrapisispora blattae CBS 6284]